MIRAGWLRAVAGSALALAFASLIQTPVFAQEAVAGAGQACVLD